jgi:hypothetical protein
MAHLRKGNTGHTRDHLEMECVDVIAILLGQSHITFVM